MYKITCLVLSIFIFLASIFYFIFRKSRKEKEHGLLSYFQKMSIGIFLSVVIMLAPVYFNGGFFWHRSLIQLLYTLLFSVRVFLVDGDFAGFEREFANVTGALFHSYHFWFVFLNVVAPVVTFTNILAMFKGVVNKVFYYICFTKPVYIFSELNDNSIVLAEDIIETKAEEKPLIVFAEVFEKNEEKDYELLVRAKAINAVCLREDISNIDILRKKPKTELFLIGDNESENISQAVFITNKLEKENRKQNVKIFVFSKSAASGKLIDSIHAPKLLTNAEKHNFNDSTFKLLRIDVIRELVWHEVPKMPILDIMQEGDQLHDISILIVGAGKYGTEFFKTLSWYTQYYGKKTYITILDQDEKTEERLKIQCPELFMNNLSDDPTEMQLDVLVGAGIDFQTDNELTQLLKKDIGALSKSNDLKHRLAKRIKECDIVVVTLGDDELNISMAIYLRTILERYSVKCKTVTVKDKTVEFPYITSLVYDDQKTSALADVKTGENKLFVPTKNGNVPYNIQFIGSLSERYKYKNIYNYQTETGSRKRHFTWHKKAVSDTSASTLQFERFEYYRQSSTAQYIYTENIRKKIPDTDIQTYQSETNTYRTEKRSDVSENMRWKAYTRSLGYVGGYPRSDRALVHNCLMPREFLSKEDLEKDKLN